MHVVENLNHFHASINFSDSGDFYVLAKYVSGMDYGRLQHRLEHTSWYLSLHVSVVYDKYKKFSV
jgi:hypothetical protein